MTDPNDVEARVQALLEALGATADADPELADTPRRFAALLRDRFRPTAPAATLEPLDAGPNPGPVALRDLPFHALCVHHVVPFFGHVHLWYQPDRRIVGFGAVGRLLDSLCRRPQLQERLVDQLADHFASEIAPRQLVVASEARQMCMELTGACKTGTTIAVASRGTFASPDDPWQIASSLLRNAHP